MPAAEDAAGGSSAAAVAAARQLLPLLAPLDACGSWLSDWVNSNNRVAWPFALRYEQERVAAQDTAPSPIQ